LLEIAEVEAAVARAGSDDDGLSLHAAIVAEDERLMWAAVASEKALQPDHVGGAR
jgi:hypothetical protein